MRNLKSKIVSVGSLLWANRGSGNKWLPKQVIEILTLHYRRTLSPFQYYDYQLHRKNAKGLWSNDYLGGYMYNELHNKLNPRDWEPISQNKWLFYAHMSCFGLPMPKMFGYFDVLNGRTCRGESLRSASDLIELLNASGVLEFAVKPVQGLKGKDILVVTRTGDDTFRSLSQQDFSRDALVAHMSRKPFIIQERVRQHPDMDRINPHNLNTVRTMTYIDTEGKPHLHFAYLRMGRHGSNTDNTHGGGIFAHIDLETGTLGEAAYLDTQPALRSHPDTGYEFAGTKVPGWELIRELSFRAAKVSPLAFAGWDIALSADGPVLIEVNTRWAFRAMQKCRPYLTPSIRDQFAEWGVPSTRSRNPAAY